jgi:hypothetical protein
VIAFVIEPPMVFIIGVFHGGQDYEPHSVRRKMVLDE